MNIQELLCEDARELNDIHLVAEFVDRFFKNYSDLSMPTLRDMHNLSQVPLPKIQSVALNKVLFNEGLAFAVRPSNSKSWASFSESGLVIINQDLLKTPLEFRLRVISHELQHALDHHKSNGKFTDPQFRKKPDFTIDDYHKFSHEINARFTELLFVLAKHNPARSNLESVIHQLMAHFKLTKDFLGTGEVADKRERRLRSRAALFWQEYQNIIAEPHTKETLWDKIKILTAKINNSTFLKILFGPV
jgi:hypothetical protein